MRIFAALFLSFFPAVLANPLESVRCPDGQTCCALESGEYACCPFVDAVCCSDRVHCCPRNHQCDVEHGLCKRQVSGLDSVPCPDGSSACPDGYTCCQLESGAYGCCPLVDAVCCSDHLHCCPHGESCDVEQGRCLSQVSTPWFEKVSSLPLTQNLTKVLGGAMIVPKRISFPSAEDFRTVVCPDQNECPDETTCCQTVNGSYGCCPYLHGFCCNDKVHCCPDGYSCDESGQRCVRHFQTNSIQKLLFQEESAQLCPDGVTKCSSKSSCCPYANGEHCCPSGTRCDPEIPGCF